MTRNLSIWNDLRPFSIGFDNLFDQFDHYLDNRSTSFPPYNIVKGKDELNWTIEMALAGYSKKDIEVKYADNTITIKSIHKDEEDKDMLHRGIAKRHFTRSFTTADTVMSYNPYPLGSKLPTGAVVLCHLSLPPVPLKLA